MNTFPGALRPLFHALCLCVLAGSPGFTEQEFESMCLIIEDAMAARPACVKRRIKLFLNIINWTSFLRWGKGFVDLDPQHQAGHLCWFENNSLVLLRQGLWGLKTFIYMGYYGRKEAHSLIHYAPLKKGNEVLLG